MGTYVYIVTRLYDGLQENLATAETATKDEAISQLSSMYGQDWENVEGEIWLNRKENLAAVVYKA